MVTILKSVEKVLNFQVVKNVRLSFLFPFETIAYPIRLIERIAIARALVRDPKILLLDEAVSCDFLFSVYGRYKILTETFQSFTDFSTRF